MTAPLTTNVSPATETRRRSGSTCPISSSSISLANRLDDLRHTHATIAFNAHTLLMVIRNWVLITMEYGSPKAAVRLMGSARFRLPRSIHPCRRDDHYGHRGEFQDVAGLTP